jgi:hypothetical protein
MAPTISKVDRVGFKDKMYWATSRRTRNLIPVTDEQWGNYAPDILLRDRNASGVPSGVQLTHSHTATFYNLRSHVLEAIRETH